jgi:hypothetical protein
MIRSTASRSGRIDRELDGVEHEREPHFHHTQQRGDAFLDHPITALPRGGLDSTRFSARDRPGWSR